MMMNMQPNLQMQTGNQANMMMANPMMPGGFNNTDIKD